MADMAMTVRHRMATGAIVAMVVLTVAGCGKRDSAGGAEGETKGLTYWPAPNAQEVALADSLVKVWNRLHPDVPVRMQPIPVSQSTEEVLLAAIAGKTAPDVCSNINPMALRDFAQAGGLVPLDSFEDFDAVARARTPAPLLETFRLDREHYYQIPWKTNPVMMFYNRRMFDAAGIAAIPRTYSEYLAAGEKMLRSTGRWIGERDIRPIWWQRMFDFYPFYVAASGGRTLFDGTEVAFGTHAAEAVFGFFRECYGRGLFPRTFFQGGDPFILEQKATHFAGPWQVAQIQKFAPAMDYGVVPLPVPDSVRAPVCTFGDFKNIAIFSTTKHPREAWEFVKFLLTAEHDLLLLEICDQIPVRGDLLTNPLFAGYFRRKPVMVTFAEQVPFTRGMDMAPDMKEIFDGISQEYEMCCVYGRKTPAEAVRDAVQRTRTILEWNR
jgi:multiple sugar transport system substrate-binding protein